MAKGKRASKPAKPMLEGSISRQEFYKISLPQKIKALGVLNYVLAENCEGDVRLAGTWVQKSFEIMGDLLSEMRADVESI